MTVPSRTVVVEVGSRLQWEGEQWQVASLGADDVLLTARARAVRVTIQALVLAGALTVHVGEGAALDGLTPLDALPADQRQLAEDRAEAIQLMRTGYRLGRPISPDEKPDPRFAPGVGQRQREIALGQMMGVTDRQIRTWAADYDQHGIVGLAHGRLAQIRRPMGECDPRVQDAILAVLDEQTYSSKINRKNTKKAVLDLVNERHALAVAQAEQDGKPAPEPPVLPKDRTFSKYFAELERGRGRHLASKQIRSIANRPKRAYGKFLATRPFQVVLIDSSPVDMFCMDIVTGKWQRVVLTLAMDLYTRSIVAWRFTPGDPDRTDACLLLHDMVTPKPMGEDWDPIAAWRYGVPESIVVDPGEHPAAGLPFGWPEQVVVDHGKIFLAHDFTEACRVLGIDVQYARPYTPTDKAHIERLFRTIREQFWQRLPGYKGPDVWSRGARTMVEDQAFLFFHELEAKFAQWVATGYQNTRHDGLELASQPGLHLTPNEMYDHGIAVAGFVRVLADPQMFVELLPTQWRTVQHYGVEINGVRYNRGTGDLPDPLEGFRSRKSPWAAQNGKWRFKADPRDLSTIYFWRPDSVDDADGPGGWAVVHRAGDYGNLPFTAAELAYAKKVVLARGLSDRDPDAVGEAVDRIVGRTRNIDPQNAQERRIAATALIRDGQARRDRGDTPRPAAGAAAHHEPAHDPVDLSRHDVPRGAANLPAQRGEPASFDAASGALVDPLSVPILATPEETEYDPFADQDGYESVGDDQ